ncbi:MAG TPA: SRPBCC domain-containing protein [Flavobacteriaceae bacterium]|nr:SRPBCC domain-containing protein [Flavobacteriaceae bacterium]
MSTSFAIYHNLFIKAPKHKVFEAVSLPEHLNLWWTLKASGEPRVGETYNLNFTDTYNWFAKVVVCTPNKAFHLKMIQSDADWNPTTFGFDLDEKENGTYLRFSHINWSQCNDAYKTASFCWAILLNALKNYLEQGSVVPFEARN